ncbi:MAG: FHA domain-containing protein [Planctomycetota bacterium]
MARLILRSAEGDQEFPFEGDEVTIGRQGCTITIQDTKSSRKHCVVRFQAGGYMLEDLNSSNGTLLNGAKVDRRALMGGDVIKIGLTEIVFQLEAGEDDMGGGDFGGGGAASDEETCLLIPEDGGMPIPIVGTVSIGRAPGNTLVIDDTKASSKHCEVYVEGGVGMIRDLESTNGTRVDGQKITETPLRQGAKIAIGKTVFVFKNPSLPDDLGESDLLESSALGADFAVVGKKANRRSMVQLVGALVVIGGIMGGAVWVSQNLLRTETQGGIQSPAGNRADVNYSFESGDSFDGVPPGWSASLEGEDTIKVESGGKSGKKKLTIERVAGSDPAAVSECIYNKDIPVPRGGGTDAVAAIRVVWVLAKGSGPLEQSYTELVTDSSGWTTVDATFAPPRNAISKARVSCAILGKEGEASFDDIEVYDAKPSDRPRKDAARAGFDLDEHGRWRLFWGEQGGSIEQQVAWLGSVVALSGGQADQSTAQIESAGAAEGGLAVKGKLFEPATGTWHPFETKVGEENGRLVLDVSVGSDGAAPAFAGVSALLGSLRVQQGVSIIDANGYASMAREFTRPEVEQLLTGASHNRIALRFTPAVQASVRLDNGTYRLQALAPKPASGPIKLRITLQAEFEAEQQAAETAKAEADAAREEGRFGIAFAKYDAIVDTFGPIRRVAGPAEKARKALREQFQTSVEELRRRHDEALFPQASVAALEMVMRRGQMLKDAWTGSEFAKEVEAVLAQADKDLTDAKIAEGERHAEAFLARAKDYANKLKQYTLARLFAQKVVREFPGTPWAEDATKLLEKIKGK